MNRTCLILVGVLLAGCSRQSDVNAPSEHHSVKSSSGAPATQPSNGAGISGITSHTPTSAPDQTAPPVPPPVSTTPIYELNQDGKIYVFAFVDHMLAFQHAGKAQPVVIEKPNFTAKGTTVVIEASDEAMAGEILASYLKQHPESKK